MINYISGTITELEPTCATLDVAGIGYDVNITLLNYSRLHLNEGCKMYVHEIIREDAHLLYGFLTVEERAMFRLLTGVSGVGASTARLILSSLNVAELQSVIASGDERSLKAVKGVGAKTAQRIIVDLKDKINIAEGALINQPMAGNRNYDEALTALVTLGFTQQQSQKVLKKIYADFPDISLENAIRTALKML